MTTTGGPAAVVAGPAPRHVAIVGLGPSCEAYVDRVKRAGGRHAFCDETWVINALGDVLACDLIFHMDDARIQEIRAEAKPDSNIAAMLKWMRTARVPIFTSRPHPDYPSMVGFPLEAVVNDLGVSYFNNTAAYAVAYAIHLGVKKLSLWGLDYTYASAADAERGRACVEFLLGMAKQRGIVIGLTDRTTLMDAMVPQDELLYGYGKFGTVDVHFEQGGDEPTKVVFTERATLPTAEEIEAAYSHQVHPNRLVAACAPKS